MREPSTVQQLILFWKKKKKSPNKQNPSSSRSGLKVPTLRCETDRRSSNHGILMTTSRNWKNQWGISPTMERSAKINTRCFFSRSSSGLPAAFHGFWERAQRGRNRGGGTRSIRRHVGCHSCVAAAPFSLLLSLSNLFH